MRIYYIQLLSAMIKLEIPNYKSSVTRLAVNFVKTVKVRKGTLTTKISPFIGSQMLLCPYSVCNRCVLERFDGGFEFLLWF